MVRTFCGKNYYLISRELANLVNSYKDKYGDFSVERLDASEVDYESILDAVQSLSLLTPNKLVVVANIESNKTLQDNVDILLDRVNEGVDLVFIEPKIDKRKSYYKTLASRSTLKELKEQQAYDIAKWVVTEASEIGASISENDAKFLIDRVGNDQLLIEKEIQKLSLYNSKITKDTIEVLTNESMQSTVFNLLDSAFRADKNKALKLYREQRASKIDPQYIIAMFTWQLQNIALAVFSENKSSTELVKRGMSPYTAQKTLDISKGVSKTKLRHMVNELSNLDLQIKTGVDADASLEYFIVTISS